MTAVHHPLRTRLALATRPVGDLAAITRAALRVAPLVAGLVCWAYSLSNIRLADVGTLGLLSAAGPWLYAGLLLLIVGFATEISGRASSLVLMLYLIALVVVAEATVPLLNHVQTPEYSWVYKHIGVAESFRVNGRVTDPSDIYQQWPAFFALIAGITSSAGTSAIRLAIWAPLAFELANCLMLVGIFRTLTRSKVVPYLGAFLFEALSAWVGQDYLSPQAFAFLLWLAVILVTLRWLVRSPDAGLSRGLRFLGAIRAYVLRGLPAQPASSVLQRRLAAVAVTVVFAVIVVAHQLTPVMGLASLAALTVVGVVRPRWLVLVLALIEIGFVVSRYHLISTEYGGLFSGGDIVSNASGDVHTWGSLGQALSAKAVRAVAAVMWGSTLLVIAWRWRALGRVIVPALLAFTPFCVLFGQSYGGEAIYRVFLFSAPWCAFLIASALSEIRRPVLRSGMYTLFPMVVLLPSLQGLWGPVSVDNFTSSELRASLYFYEHAPAGSAMILADEDFPGLETANYASFDLQYLPSDPQIGPAWLNSGNISDVDAWVTGLKAPQDYLVMSDSMLLYAKYYGYPLGFARLSKELPTSRSWVVWYRNADVTIYRFAT